MMPSSSWCRSCSNSAFAGTTTGPMLQQQMVWHSLVSSSGRIHRKELELHARHCKACAVVWFQP
eukprot:1247179-Amphidinium_carterae.2